MQYLDRPVNHPNTAAWFAGLIRRFRVPNADVELLEYAAAEFGATPIFAYYPRTEFCPAWFAARHDGLTIVAIDGASTLRQLQVLADDYSGVIQSGYRDPHNQVVNNNAAAIQAVLKERGFWQGEVMKLAGWSFGGAIASMIPIQQAVKPATDPRKEIVTFGSPRPAGESLRRLMQAEATITRYMNTEDPIPLIPLRTSDLAALPVIIGVRQALRWGNFCHTSGGLEILPDYSIRASELPTQAAANMVTSLANWYFSVEGDDSNFHAIQMYQSRLAVQVERSHSQAAPRVAPAEPVSGETRGEIIASERRTQETLYRVEREQNSVPLSIPKPERLQYVKIGKVHYATFKGLVVATNPSKRKIRGIVREMNSALDRLQTVAVVDTESFVKAFEQYLNEAGDPSGDFSPVMQTTWNLGAF